MNIDNLIPELYSNKVKKMILDTDAFNEEDDQFAISYAILSSDKVDVLSFNAVPFLNSNSVSPEDGMEKSYNEIFHMMDLLGVKKPVYKGARHYLTSKTEPVESPACDNIIKTVMESEETIYIVAIGAITNVASAIIKCPEIVNKAVVIWLGGTAHHIPYAMEFNLSGDLLASQVVFDSKIPLVQVPCEGVCTEFVTDLCEIEHFIGNKNPLCDYLISKCKKVIGYGQGKIIWDVTAVACLVHPEYLVMAKIPTPIITNNHTYSFDMGRHHQVYVRKILRDPLYMDLFNKIANL